MGFVVRDMDQGHCRYESHFGMATKLATLQNPENKYRGQPSDCVAQLAYLTLPY